MNLYVSTYGYTHCLETLFRGFNAGPNSAQNSRIPVWEMTCGTKGCVRIVRLAAILHHSKRHKHWKLLAAGLDFPEDSGKEALTWVTLFKAEFCNISLVAVFGHDDQRLTAWSVHKDQSCGFFQARVVVGMWHLVSRSNELLEAASRTTSLSPSQQHTSKGVQNPGRQGLAVEQHNNVFGCMMCKHTSSAHCSLLHRDSNGGPGQRSQILAEHYPQLQSHRSTRTAIWSISSQGNPGITRSRKAAEDVFELTGSSYSFPCQSPSSMGTCHQSGNYNTHIPITIQKKARWMPFMCPSEVLCTSLAAPPATRGQRRLFPHPQPSTDTVCKTLFPATQQSLQQIYS